MHRFTYFDLFSGIGGFRLALDELGGKCLGHSEINKKCSEIYDENYPGTKYGNLGDIKKIDRLPEVPDLIVGGVPCQPWSAIGKNKGFRDDRGLLWNDAIRVVVNTQPKYFVFENVAGLTSPKNLANLNYIINSFNQVGYTVSYKVCNALDVGLAQDRKRLFIVGTKSDEVYDKYPKEIRWYERGTTIAKVLTDLPQYEFNPPVNHLLNMFRSSTTAKPNRLANVFYLNDEKISYNTVNSWDYLIEDPSLKELARKLYNGVGWFNAEPQRELDLLISLGVLIKRDGKYKFKNTWGPAGVKSLVKIYLAHSYCVGTITRNFINHAVATKPFYGESYFTYKDEFIKEILKPGNYRKLTLEDGMKLQGFPKFYPGVNPIIVSNAIPPQLAKEVIRGLF